MYEARQNKEKVSRRIERMIGGGMWQRLNVYEYNTLKTKPLKKDGKIIQFCGDTSDEEDAEDEKAKLAHERLVRANQRAKGRPLPPLGKRVEKTNVFGKVGLSRNRFRSNEPQTTSRKTDYPEDSKIIGANYESWEIAITDWPKFSQAMDTQKIPDTYPENELRASSMMLATTQDSEPYRFPAAAKIAREAIRKKSKNTAQSFGKLFPMAQKGGAHAYEPFLKGDLHSLTEEQIQVLLDMSTSSEEEVPVQKDMS